VRHPWSRCRGGSRRADLHAGRPYQGNKRQTAM